MKAGEYLKGIDYPGRIILCGISESGEDILMYAVTGRSQNSRRRLFSLEGSLLRTIPAEGVSADNPELLVYTAKKKVDDTIIIANGRHTDLIADCLACGKSFEDAVASMTYEPDAPIFTPRISLAMRSDSYSMAVVSKAEDSDQAVRKVFSYEKERGICHICHTYQGDPEHVEAFSSAPVRIDAGESAFSIASDIWDALRPEYRVSVYVSFGCEEILVNGGCDE